MYKKILCLLGCTVILVFMSVVYTYSVSEDLGNNIVRLHVIANSNSKVDQDIKYKVRDKFLKESEKLENSNFSSNIMTQIANSVLEDNNVYYGAHCEIGDFYFEKKSYENITLPCGTYRGVRIVLGEGAGENWWCVLSPPMCFTTSAVGCAEKDMLKVHLNSDTIDVITDEGGVNYKFKLVELVKEILSNEV